VFLSSASFLHSRRAAVAEAADVALRIELDADLLD
jgi:hypothetical protein